MSKTKTSIFFGRIWKNLEFLHHNIHNVRVIIQKHTKYKICKTRKCNTFSRENTIKKEKSQHN